MNINQQIKNHREKHQISQEELAEVLYVSRQTISNWETKKTYPDLRSLLMMSDYFETSLDELVKGDLNLMKQKQSLQAINTWSVLALMGILAGIVGVQVILSYEINQLYFILVAMVMGFSLFAAYKIEVIKKQEDLQTYKEIKAYLANQSLSEEEKRDEEAKKDKSKVPSILLKLVSGAVFAVVVTVMAKMLINL